MRVRPVFKTEIQSLRPIAQSWAESTSDNQFNIEIDVEHHMTDLADLALSKTSDLLVLFTDSGRPVGYMGLQTFNSPLGRQVIANEHYWYVMPEHRGRGSVELIKQARAWARQQKCSHMIMNASNLASDLHDRVCRLYARLGMKKFETSYIQEIE